MPPPYCSAVLLVTTFPLMTTEAVEAYTAPPNHDEPVCSSNDPPRARPTSNCLATSDNLAVHSTTGRPPALVPCSEASASLAAILGASRPTPACTTASSLSHLAPTATMVCPATRGADNVK